MAVVLVCDHVRCVQYARDLHEPHLGGGRVQAELAIVVEAGGPERSVRLDGVQTDALVMTKLEAGNIACEEERRCLVCTGPPDRVPIITGHVQLVVIREHKHVDLRYLDVLDVGNRKLDPSRLGGRVAQAKVAVVVHAGDEEVTGLGQRCAVGVAADLLKVGNVQFADDHVRIGRGLEEWDRCEAVVGHEVDGLGGAIRIVLASPVPAS